MKQIRLKEKGNRTVVVETKWLRIEEAAAYLGVVRSTFDEVRQRIPHGQISGVVVYDCNVLDRYANGELPEEAYAPATASDVMQTRRRGEGRFASTEGLVHPITGKVYGGSKKQIKSR